MGFTRLLRNLCRDEQIGPRVVPIIPDEARTFGMDALFRELKIYAAQGQKYEPVDHDLLLSYSESNRRVRSSRRASPKPGSMASFIAAATSYAHARRPDGAVLHLLFDVRVPARRRPHLAGRRLPGARVPARRHGRPHDAARRGPAAPGRPRCCSPARCRPCQAYDPAFAYEVGAIVQAGLERMYGPTRPTTTATSSTTSRSTTRTT